MNQEDAVVREEVVKTVIYSGVLYVVRRYTPCTHRNNPDCTTGDRTKGPNKNDTNSLKDTRNVSLYSDVPSDESVVQMYKSETNPSRSGQEVTVGTAAPLLNTRLHLSSRRCSTHFLRLIPSGVLHFIIQTFIRNFAPNKQERSQFFLVHFGLKPLIIVTRHRKQMK